MNLDCKNIFIIYYPPGAGGKFIINCLALTNDVVLQDEVLAKEDLSGNLTIRNKFDLLRNRLEKEDAYNWKDLELGDIQLFGIGLPQFNKRYFLNKKIISSAVTQLSYSDKIFFNVCHSIQQLEVSKNIFKNAKVIQLINASAVVDRRKRNYKVQNEFKLDYYHKWKTIKGVNWGEAPTSLEELYARQEYDEIKNNFPELLFSIIKCFEIEKIKSEIVGDYLWDCNNFLDETSFIKAIKKLASDIGISEPNMIYTKELYNIWFTKNFN